MATWPVFANKNTAELLMKPGITTIMLLAGLLLSVTSTPATAAVRMMGAGNVSCKEWTQLRSSTDYFSAGNWILGFLSSTSWNTGNDILAGKETEVLFAVIDKYCANMPEMTIADAALDLATHLLDKNPPE